MKRLIIIIISLLVHNLYAQNTEYWINKLLTEQAEMKIEIEALRGAMKDVDPDPPQKPLDSCRVLCEDWHIVGTLGEPDFQNTWQNRNIATFLPARFRKEGQGVVRIEGIVERGLGFPWIMPIGYRPLKEVWLDAHCTFGHSVLVRILPTGEMWVDVDVHLDVVLNSITYTLQ